MTKENVEIRANTLAYARDTDDWEVVTLKEIWLGRDYYELSTRHFFAVDRRNPDYESRCESKVYSTFTEAKTALKAILEETFRYTGSEERHKKFEKVELSEDFYDYLREEEEEDDYDCPSATRGDYGPSNPWDAPGMKVSDFISGVIY